MPRWQPWRGSLWGCAHSLGEPPQGTAAGREFLWLLTGPHTPGGKNKAGLCSWPQLQNLGAEQVLGVPLHRGPTPHLRRPPCPPPALPCREPGFCPGNAFPAPFSGDECRALAPPGAWPAPPAPVSVGLGACCCLSSAEKCHRLSPVQGCVHLLTLAISRVRGMGMWEPALPEPCSPRCVSQPEDRPRAEGDPLLSPATDTPHSPAIGGLAPSGPGRVLGGQQARRASGRR